MTPTPKQETLADLLQIEPSMAHPIRCENGCGTIIELTQSFRSYKRDEKGEPLLICECCAADEGHVDEDLEEPDESPVCTRKQQ